MRYRQLPPAGEVSDIETVWEAVPEHPNETSDCCRRICERTLVETREHASQWLVFLTALGCATDGGDGYVRSECTLAVEALADRFESRVFAVPEVLSVLETAERPLTREEIADRLVNDARERLDRTEEPTTYLDRLLAWGVTFDLLAVRGERYSLATASDAT